MTATTQARSSSAAAAIGWMASAVLLLTIMDATVKWLAGQGYTVAQLLFFRSLFSLPLFAVAVWRHGGPAILHTRRPWGHLARALIGTSTMACFFFAYKYMALADAVAISFAAPLFSTLLSVLILGEYVGLRRWVAVTVGFVGVLIMLRPGAGMFQPAALIALGGAASYASATIVIRQLSRTEPAIAIVFYYMLVSLAVSALFLPFAWHPVDPFGLVLLAGVGLIGGLAQFAITFAIRIGPIALIAPFDYTALLWAVLFGYALFGDLPDGPTLLGAAIVIGSGLYILYRETRRGARADVTAT
jgi:drug/metabolite transporter (DMT)-like permease